MKKNLISLILALVLLTVSFAAVAEETLPERELGNYPERGIVIGITEEDKLAGIGCTFSAAATAEVTQLPIFEINYADETLVEELFHQYETATEEELNDEEFVMNLLLELLSCNFNLYQIALFESDYIAEKKADTGMLEDIPLNDETILGENDGYVYILISNAEQLVFENKELQARVEAAHARATELIDTITFQEIVFAEGEFTEVPDVITAFETQDLNGNTVTNDIFAGKDLTVINIWGTFCNPCIDEMPELAAWSAEMPENMQIIGLVSDLASAQDAETFELAVAICEATGANAYTHLIANEDFAELLSGVVGVPTTLFVDSMGRPVADPVVGANVPMCQKLANDYLQTL